MSRETSKGLLISIVFPTYSRAHIIIGAIMSIFNQTYKNFSGANL